MKKILFVILFLVFALMAFTLNLKNPQEITVDYYFNLQWTGPLVWFLAVLFLFGLIMGWIIASVSLLKSRHQTGKVKRQLVKVEKEAEALRLLQENKVLST